MLKGFGRFCQDYPRMLCYIDKDTSGEAQKEKGNAT